MKQIDDIIEQIREKNMECRSESVVAEGGRKVWRYVAAAAPDFVNASPESEIIA